MAIPDTPSKAKSNGVEKSILQTLPWSITHFGGQSEIETFIADTDAWKSVATVYAVGDIDAEDLAAFIMQTANSVTHTRRAVAPIDLDGVLMGTSYLAPREREILTLVARGRTRKQISGMLSIKERTIKTYIGAACQKLNALNKTQAVAVAMTLGWIVPYRKK